MGSDNPSTQCKAPTKETDSKMNYWPGSNIFKTKTNCFNWKGSPSIFTRKGEVNLSHRQVIEHALRHNHESTLGAAAGFVIGKKK